MYRTTLAVLLLILAAIGAYAVHTVGPIFGKDGELAQKHEWSILQVYSQKYREQLYGTEMPIVERVEQSRCIVIGLPLENKLQGYVWLIANPEAGPKVKLMPAGEKFKLTKEGLKHIRAETKLDPAVLAFLEQHLTQ